MPTAGEQLPPGVERGGGGGEHDEILLLQAETAHLRGGVVDWCPAEDPPGDSVRAPRLLQSPHMGGQRGGVPSRHVPEVPHVLSVPRLELPAVRPV